VTARLVRMLPLFLWAMALSMVLGLLAIPIIQGHAISEVAADPIVIVFLVFVLAFVSVGALVASKRPGNPLGWVMLAAGIAYSVAGISTAWVEEFVDPGMQTSLPASYLGWVSSWMWGIGPFISGTYLLLLFPDGHLPSPRWRPVARAIGVGIVMVVAEIAFKPGPMDIDAPVEISNPLGIGAMGTPIGILGGIGAAIAFAGILVSVASLFVRYRRAAVQTRMQIRWLAFAAAAAVLFVTGGAAIEAVVGSDATELNNIIVTVSLTMLPISIGVAILRYRLYDIDRIINRTIVYTVVTGSAVAVYAGTVFVVGTVVVGSSDNLTVAVATLAAAAVFRPALKWVQSFVDRRFYRHKYDAQHTIDAFGVRLREETDLDELTGDLVALVRTTMQPETVSVWLTGSEKTAGASRLVGKASSDLAETPPAR
jgi:hypothetical protein